MCFFFFLLLLLLLLGRLGFRSKMVSRGEGYDIRFGGKKRW